MSTRIKIEQAANGVILSTPDEIKVFELGPGRRSKAVHDLLKEVALNVDADLDVDVRVQDPQGIEAEVFSRTPKRKLRETDVEKEYSVNVRTLQEWRRQGKGPAFEKPGGSVFYDRQELDAFFKRHRVVTTGAV